MIRLLVNTVPAWQLALALVGVTVLVAVLAVVGARLAFRRVRAGGEADVRVALLGVLGTFAALLLALTVASQYEHQRLTEELVRREVAQLVRVDRASGGLAVDTAGEVRLAVRRYAASVVEDEWPAMREGRESPAASVRLDTLLSILQDYQPRTPTAAAWYADAVAGTQELVAVRQARLAAAASEPPVLLWVLLVTAGLLVVAAAVLVGSSSRGFHLFGAVAVAVLVSLSLALAADLAYPFSGDASVSTDAYLSGPLD